MANERDELGKFVKGHKNLFTLHTEEAKKKISKAHENPIDKETLNMMYNIKKMSICKIAKELHRCRYTVSKYLQKYDINIDQSRRHKIYPNFDNIVEIAYVLGVVCGDGYITHNIKRRQHVIGLTAKDMPFIESFKESLEHVGLNSSICEDRCYYKLSANSILLYDFINKMKSDYNNIIEFCNTSEAKIQFIRGFYESEGHDRGNGRGMQMSNTEKNLLDLVKTFLLEALDIDAHYSTTGKTPDKTKDVYLLYIPSKYKQSFIEHVHPVIKVVDMTTIKDTPVE